MPRHQQAQALLGGLGSRQGGDDVAAAVLFLASREAGYITGQVIYVDGGKLSYVPGVDVLKSGLEATPS